MIRKAFGNDAVSIVQIKVWYKHFKDGQESFKVIDVMEVLQQAEHLRILNV